MAVTTIEEQVASPPKPYVIPPDLEVPDSYQRVYRQAHDLLIEKGWCRAIYEDGKGRHCLMGALNVAMGYPANAGKWKNSHDGGTIRFIERVLHRPIPTWNDKVGRAKRHVLGLLEELYA